MLLNKRILQVTLPMFSALAIVYTVNDSLARTSGGSSRARASTRSNESSRQKQRTKSSTQTKILNTAPAQVMAPLPTATDPNIQRTASVNGSAASTSLPNIQPVTEIERPESTSKELSTLKTCLKKNCTAYGSLLGACYNTEIAMDVMNTSCEDEVEASENPEMLQDQALEYIVNDFLAKCTQIGGDPSKQISYDESLDNDGWDDDDVDTDNKPNQASGRCEIEFGFGPMNEKMLGFVKKKVGETLSCMAMNFGVSEEDMTAKKEWDTGTKVAFTTQAITSALTVGLSAAQMVMSAKDKKALEAKENGNQCSVKPKNKASSDCAKVSGVTDVSNAADICKCINSKGSWYVNSKEDLDTAVAYSNDFTKSNILLSNIGLAAQDKSELNNLGDKNCAWGDWNDDKSTGWEFTTETNIPNPDYDSSKTDSEKELTKNKGETCIPSAAAAKARADTLYATYQSENSRIGRYVRNSRIDALVDQLIEKDAECSEKIAEGLNPTDIPACTAVDRLEEQINNASGNQTVGQYNSAYSAYTSATERKTSLETAAAERGTSIETARTEADTKSQEALGNIVNSATGMVGAYMQADMAAENNRERKDGFCFVVDRSQGSPTKNGSYVASEKQQPTYKVTYDSY